jgi:hypothetical protein
VSLKTKVAAAPTLQKSGKAQPKSMTINAFITSVKNGQVQREITLLHLVAFNTAAKESLCTYGLLQHQERKKKTTRKSHPSFLSFIKARSKPRLISTLIIYNSNLS